MSDTPTHLSAAHAASVLEPYANEDSLALRLAANGTEVELPQPAVRALIGALTELAQSDSPDLSQAATELTTQQAADLLNVSRPYVVKLLDNGEIPHRKVGNRRRVLLSDLRAYQRVDSARRRSAADQLTAEAQRLGLEY